MNPARPTPLAEPLTATYWDALRRHEFLLPRRADTGEFFLPIHTIGVDEFDWAPAPRTGNVVSYSWVHLQPSEGYTDQLPYALATVRLDGGPQLMCNIIDATEDELKIGARVELVFEDRADGWVVPQFALSHSESGAAQ